MKNNLTCHCGHDPQSPEKRTILKLFLIFLLFPFCVSVSAQDSISQDPIIQEKLQLANKLILANGHERALQLYTECAAAGNAYAMNAIGVMKQRGWGTEIDEAGSVQWFEQAANVGYANAYYNLFNIYSKALGAEQDFVNAVNYLDALQNTAYRTTALMRLGYYYYKGFGVEQNYETAVNYFLQAAEDNHADALYFLGLCYRNGYGVAQNEAEAQYYLSRAAELGHYYSPDELQEETPEVIPQSQRIELRGYNGNRETEESRIPREYRRVARQNFKEITRGEYTGTIVMYDYSGKNMVRTSALKIVFDDTHNGKIFGRWIENDTIFATFEAILTDSALQFIDTEYRHTERYSRNVSKRWKFNNAVLEKTDTDSVSYLTGNIQQYDMKLKEPGKPLYISLQKRNFTDNTGENEGEETPAVEAVKSLAAEPAEATTPSEKESKDFFIAYPNPFDSEINLLFSLENEQNVTLTVYGINGKLIDRQNLGVLPEGTHNYLLAFSAQPGQYLLVLQRGDRKISNLIIKK